jgi:hypothetical protein
MLRILRGAMRNFLMIMICAGCADALTGTVNTSRSMELNCDGEMCVHDGFEVLRDGFSFANWNDVEQPHSVVNTTLLVSMFGHSLVCRPSAVDVCTPTPRAQHVIREWNAALIGGRCEGMATLSERMFMSLSRPRDFDDVVIHPTDLRRGNKTLESEITYWWATQFVDEVVQIARESRSKRPSQLVAELIQGLRTTAGYTLGIYDKGMGHAVTPFAVSTTDDGWRIHIYDNNYPGVENHIDVLSSTERWVYSPVSTQDTQQSNGFISIHQWSGSTGSIELTPMHARSGPFACGTCKDSGTSSEDNSGYVLSLIPLSRHAEIGVEITTPDGRVSTLHSEPFEDDSLGITVTKSKDGTMAAVTQIRIPSSVEEFDVRVQASSLTAFPPPVLLSLSHPHVASVQINGFIAQRDNAGSSLITVNTSEMNVRTDVPVAVSVAATADLFDIDMEAGHTLTLSRPSHTNLVISDSDSLLFTKHLLGTPLRASSEIRLHSALFQGTTYAITQRVMPEDKLPSQQTDRTNRPTLRGDSDTSATTQVPVPRQTTENTLIDGGEQTGAATIPQNSQTTTTTTAKYADPPQRISVVSTFSQPPHVLFVENDNLAWIRVDGQRALFQVTGDGVITRKDVDGIPLDIAKDNVGAIWAVLQQPDRLVRITDNSVTYFSHPLLVEPTSLLFHPSEEHLYFTGGRDTSSYVGSLSPSRQFEFRVLTDIARPDMITLGTQSSVWFVDSQGRSIGRKNADNSINVFRRSTAMPRSLTFGPDGAMWFANNVAGQEIGRISVNGTFSFLPAPQGVQTIRSIATSTDGALWMTSRGHIVRMSIDRQFIVIPDVRPWGQSSLVSSSGQLLWFANASFLSVSRIAM